jgi:hypothetical protein|tara:strand:+ start:28 stop:240 length:213 start_codon:yes stop_codon:yes gene_type:complete
MEKKIEDLTKATVKILDFIQDQITINNKMIDNITKLQEHVTSLNTKIIMLEGQNHIIDVVNNIGRRGDNR